MSVVALEEFKAQSAAPVHVLFNQERGDGKPAPAMGELVKINPEVPVDVPLVETPDGPFDKVTCLEPASAHNKDGFTTIRLRDDHGVEHDIDVAMEQMTLTAMAVHVQEDREGVVLNLAVAPVGYVTKEEAGQVLQMV